MKDLDRGKGKNVVPPQAEAAYTQGQRQQELADYKRDKKRIEAEKDTLHEKLEQEKTERLSFEQRLEQAMRDLGISQDKENHAIAVVDKTIAALNQTTSDRDKAISSRNSAIGRLGGLTAHRNRLREKVETLSTKNESLQNSLKLAMEQVVAANQQREAFREGYQKIKAAYQKLKFAYQNLKIDQQNSHTRIEKLQTDFDRLKMGYKKLKVEYEKLRVSDAQDLVRPDTAKIATAYRKMSCVERSQLPPELKLLLDQLEGNYPG